ncbi:MAG: hypothetical protein HQ521_12565 [Bacteroidetes bacterium]|nr:hypothetical protein [Bacteroidota bacterium]
MKYRYLPLLFVFVSCNYYDAGEEKSNFELSLNHSIIRVVDTSTVSLSWSEYYLEFYNKTLIQRFTENVDSSWQTVTEFQDVSILEYGDTIYDDENLNYRVGLADNDGNIIWTTSNITIPKTTHLYFPSEVQDTLIQTAFNNAVIDDYDTLYIFSGEYRETLNLINKSVILIAVCGASTVTIDGGKTGRSITMNSGEIHGFNIINGFSMNGDPGGGIRLSGNASIFNCKIYDNTSTSVGGGIYSTGSSNVYNTIIYNNMSAFHGSGIYIANSDGNIVNTTIIGNDIGIGINTDSLMFLNNIIVFPDTLIYLDTLSQATQATIKYNLYSNSYYIIGTDYILGYPHFIDNYRLLDTSPGINAGHPDARYNNADGTRNTMGAYGGPFGARWSDD